jgi:F-type H+-transporting ATPase subunit b
MEVFPNWTFVPIVLFLMVLTYILNRTFFRPMQKTLDERTSRIEGARKEADEIRKSSQERLADFDRRMREARREADQQMAQVKNEALSEKSKLVSQRRSEVEKMIVEAQRDLREKTESARTQLQQQADAFASQIASHILDRPLSPKK